VAITLSVVKETLLIIFVCDCAGVELVRCEFIKDYSGRLLLIKVVVNRDFIIITFILVLRRCRLIQTTSRRHRNRSKQQLSRALRQSDYSQMKRLQALSIASECASAVALLLIRVHLVVQF
jgi:hypothetical protein